MATSHKSGDGETLGSRFSRERKARRPRITQKQLGDAIGLDQATLSRFERGVPRSDGNPIELTTSQVEEAAAFFGLKFSELMGGLPRRGIKVRPKPLDDDVFLGGVRAEATAAGKVVREPGRARPRHSHFD